MKNISNLFGEIYVPTKAVVFYERTGEPENGRYFAELFPIGADGCPLAAHPLSTKEGEKLAQSLLSGKEKENTFLRLKGIMPENVLHLSHVPSPKAIWWTPCMKTNLLFKENLDIDCGPAFLPPLLWKANREKLTIYALKKDQRPDLRTRLCHAPFFNIHPGGEVCMGTVKIDLPFNCYLEEFMQAWQHYFFNSYFSHMIGDRSPVSSNIVELWQGLVNKDRPFPLETLTTTTLTLQNIIK